MGCRSQAAAAELGALGDNVTPVIADCVEPAGCAALVDACVAGGRALTHVLSTLGGVEASSVGSPNLMEAVAGLGTVERFVLMTSLGCGETWDHLAPQAQKFLHDELKAKDVAEEHLLASGLPYCLVRPGGLHAGTEPATGTGVLTAGDPTVSGSINRSDLAVLTMQCLTAPGLENVVCSAVDAAKKGMGGQSPEIDEDSVVSEPYAVHRGVARWTASTNAPGKTGDHDTDSAERPSYEVLSVDSEHDFEVRRYPSLIVAETAMSPESRANESGRGDGDPNPFMTLAGFIGVLATPKNKAQDSEEPVPIAMTSPVLSPGDSTSMSFVMPSEFTMENMPVPTDDAVTVRETEPAVYAVKFVGGWARDGEMQDAAKSLRAAVEGQGLAVKVDDAGEPVWLQARYDSPCVAQVAAPAVRRACLLTEGFRVLQLGARGQADERSFDGTAGGAECEPLVLILVSSMHVRKRGPVQPY